MKCVHVTMNSEYTITMREDQFVCYNTPGLPSNLESVKRCQDFRPSYGGVPRTFKMDLFKSISTDRNPSLLASDICTIASKIALELMR